MHFFFFFLIFQNPALVVPHGNFSWKSTLTSAISQSLLYHYPFPIKKYKFLFFHKKRFYIQYFYSSKLIYFYVSHFSFTPIQKDLPSDFYLLSFLASSTIKFVIFCMNKMQQKEMVLCFIFPPLFSSYFKPKPAFIQKFCY